MGNRKPGEGSLASGLAIQAIGTSPSQLVGLRDDGVQRRIDGLDSGDVRIHHLTAAQLAPGDEAAQFGRSEQAGVGHGSSLSMVPAVPAPTLRCSRAALAQLFFLASPVFFRFRRRLLPYVPRTILPRRVRMSPLPIPNPDPINIRQRSYSLPGGESGRWSPTSAAAPSLSPAGTARVNATATPKTNRSRHTVESFVRADASCGYVGVGRRP